MNGWLYPDSNSGLRGMGRVTEVGISGYEFSLPELPGQEDGAQEPTGGVAPGGYSAEGSVQWSPGISPQDQHLSTDLDPTKKGASVAKRAVRQSDLDPIGEDKRLRVNSAINAEVYSTDESGQTKVLWYAAAAILAIYLIRRV